MMDLETRINEEIKKAMLAKDKDQLNALRAVKSALLLLKTEKGSSEITPEKELQVLQRLVKQREDAAGLYKEQGRDDLYREEKIQMDIIARFLPEQLSDEEIMEVLRQLIEEHQISGSKEMGRLMGMASKALAGKADNRRISDMVKKLLNN